MFSQLNTTTTFLTEDLLINTTTNYSLLGNITGDGEGSGGGGGGGSPGEAVFTTPGYALAWISLSNVLVLVTGVLGNALVIAVVTCVRDMRTPTNLCLMNLSMADLLVLLICQPSAMLEFYEEEKWMLGAFMCKLTIFLENAVCLASILIILSISFERYYAVCYPLRQYSTESRSKALVLMGLMWLTAALLTSPSLAIAQTSEVYHFVLRENVTVCHTSVLYRWHYVYVTGQFLVVFVVPLALLIFVYSRIIFKVAVDTMDSRQMTDTARAQVQRSRQQLVIMLVGIIVLFFVCLLPFRIIGLCWIYHGCHMESEAELNVLHLFRLLVYVNSAGNPLIYSLVSTKFRRAFSRVLLRCGCRCKCLLPRGGGSRGGSRLEENGTTTTAHHRRTTVTHYTSVRQDQEEGEEAPSEAL